MGTREERRVRRREQELMGERGSKQKVRAAISLPLQVTSQTVDVHRPLGPTSSLPARRALPRIPEEEEKSCLGSTSGSIGNSCYRAWREEMSPIKAAEEPRKVNISPKRSTNHGDWENPYWSRSSPILQPGEFSPLFVAF